MLKILSLYFYYFLFIFSSVGYGLLSINKLKTKKNFEIGFIGLIGLLCLICLSYATNFLFEHNYIHNLIVINLGLLFCIYYFYKNLKTYKNDFKKVILIFSIIFIGILLYKNHDDFFYYHFQYTLSLINFKKIIGIGLLEHGYRTPSSIFYLNSLFYLPGIKYFLLHSGAIYVFGFSILFLLNNIFTKINTKEINSDFYLSLLSFIFITTVFYRISEHGTDRSALILIFLLSLVYIESINYKKLNSNYVLQSFFEKIIVLVALIVSFKSFYLIYFVFIFIWFYQIRDHLYKIEINLKNILLLFSILSPIFVLATMFLNTGCFVYPASFTCLSNLDWSINIDQVNKMKSWYELWSKSGATPNYRVDNPEIYLSNLNWVSNWFSNYFLTKVSDLILVIIVILVIVISSLHLFTKRVKKLKQGQPNQLIIYLVLILLFLEWFFNHPALRYGGYSVIALLVFIPFSNYLCKFELNVNIIKKRVIFLIVISFSVYITKNIQRIIFENEKYDYNPIENPFFYINKDGFDFNNILQDIKDKNYINSNYIYINKKIIKNLD